MTVKYFVNRVAPPFLIEILRKFSKYGWHGNYSSWEEASGKCSGYDNGIILQKVKSSLLKVKNGEAVFERDSVIFNEIKYSWPLLAGILKNQINSDGKVSILDFGGSLGSHYFQNKAFLSGAKSISWNVVEQDHFVKCGREHFQNYELKFYFDTQTCLEKEKPDILILSSVLQYMKEPYELLKELLAYPFKTIIIDRTGFLRENRPDKITVQRVPPSIYKASYPCWVFNMQKFNLFFELNAYKKFAAFKDNEAKINLRGIDFYCIIFEKQKK